MLLHQFKSLKNKRDIKIKKGQKGKRREEERREEKRREKRGEKRRGGEEERRRGGEERKLPHPSAWTPHAVPPEPSYHPL